MSKGTSQKRQRACDKCRAQKGRCDGPQRPGQPCSTCAIKRLACTYVGISKRRRPTAGYADDLEERIQRIQILLEKYASRAEISRALGFSVEIDEVNYPRNLLHDVLPEVSSKSGPASEGSKILEHVDTWYTAESPHDGASDVPCEPVECSLGGDRFDKSRFEGKSSNDVFVRTAHEFLPSYDAPHSFPCARLQFWRHPDWFHPHFQENNYTEYPAFPPPDLLRSLVDLYFRHVNPFYPVLHRQTFEAQFADRFHERDSYFALLLLMVCAVGSVHSKDPRVLENIGGVLVPGYRFYFGIRSWKPPLAPVDLTSLQAVFLMGFYHHSLGSLQPAWLYFGIGLRLAQDVGAHLKTSLLGENWTRTVWCLVTLDRLTGVLLGRTSLRDEDFDLEPPSAQPDDEKEGERLIYFTFSLRITILMGVATRTVYSLRSNDPGWESRVIDKLDAGSRRWFSLIPEHLRWDPHQPDMIRFEQSANLYSGYYYLLLLIHRPHKVPGGAPWYLSRDVEVCAETALSSSRMLHVVARRCGSLSTPQICLLFVTSVVLLMSIWARRETNAEAQSIMELEAEFQQSVILLHTGPRPWSNLPTRRLMFVLSLSQPGENGLKLTEQLTGRKYLREMSISSDVAYPGPDTFNFKERYRMAPETLHPPMPTELSRVGLDDIVPPFLEELPDSMDANGFGLPSVEDTGNLLPMMGDQSSDAWWAIINSFTKAAFTDTSFPSSSSP